MGQNPEYLSLVLLPTPSPVLANINSIPAYDVPDTEDIGLPTEFRFNVGPALQPIPGSMPCRYLTDCFQCNALCIISWARQLFWYFNFMNRFVIYVRKKRRNIFGGHLYDADPALINHPVCCILCASTFHSTNTVSMLTHGLRRWAVIETALGDCTVFSDCCIMLVTFKIPASETPDNTIHWPNADIMLDHRLRRWVNIIPAKPFKLLTTNIIVNSIISEHLLKTKVFKSRTWKVIFVHKNWCTEMSTISHTKHPSSP